MGEGLILSALAREGLLSKLSRELFLSPVQIDQHQNKFEIILVSAHSAEMNQNMCTMLTEENLHSSIYICNQESIFFALLAFIWSL